MSARDDFADALAGVRRKPLVQRLAEKVSTTLGGRWVDGTLRFKRCEVSFRPHSPGIGLHGWGDSHDTLVLSFVLATFYVHLPRWVFDDYDVENAYCAEFTNYALRFQWGSKSLCLWYPWDWKHVRRSWLNKDGSLHHNESRRPGRAVVERAPEETKETHPYTYVLKNGKVQHVTATIHGEEREWRWRAFTWLPYPRKVQRTINVDFSDEVGERSGSWKGGTVGCGYEWLPGESLEFALRRMELERKF